MADDEVLNDDELEDEADPLDPVDPLAAPLEPGLDDFELPDEDDLEEDEDDLDPDLLASEGFGIEEDEEL